MIIQRWNALLLISFVGLVPTVAIAQTNQSQTHSVCSPNLSESNNNSMTVEGNCSQTNYEINNQYMNNSPCSIQAVNSPNIAINDWICTIPNVYVQDSNPDIEWRREGRGATELPLYRITETRGEGRNATEEPASSIKKPSGRRVP